MGAWEGFRTWDVEPAMVARHHVAGCAYAPAHGRRAGCRVRRGMGSHEASGEPDGAPQK